jgi:hypothetical protein
MLPDRPHGTRLRQTQSADPAAAVACASARALAGLGAMAGGVRFPPPRHHRSTSAFVLSRPGGAPPREGTVPGSTPIGHARAARRLWTAVATWVVLGALIAALWALLLLGDSLKPAEGSAAAAGSPRVASREVAGSPGS